MGDYSRGSVLAGEEILLRTVFIDSMGNLIDPDGSPSVPPVLYIYDESVDTETIGEEMDAMTFASSITGAVNATRLSPGYYEYAYTVPTSYEPGLWHDVWVGVVNGIINITMLDFTVEEAIIMDPQSIEQNTMIVVELDDTITNLAGDSALEEQRLYYTTTYNPLYASPDLVRMEMGPWIDYIPDDTLALMIHWASLEAQFIQGPHVEAWGNIKLARTKFVIYDAALRAAMQAGGGNSAGYASGARKSLGDLMIDQGDIVDTVDKTIVEYIREQRHEWWRVVNSGGNIVPGQGFAPTFSVKGQFDPDRRNTGRLWEDPSQRHFNIPTVNRKTRDPNRRRGRWGYVEPRRKTSTYPSRPWCD